MKTMLGLVFSLFLAFAAHVAHAVPVDVNQADAKTIASSLKGVGIKKAQAIVDYRKKHGPFKSANDLAKVKGIGNKTIEKNRKDILLTQEKPASK